MSHVWTFIVDMALKDIEETKIGKYVISVQTKIVIILVIKYIFFNFIDQRAVRMHRKCIKTKKEKLENPLFM